MLTIDLTDFAIQFFARYFNNKLTIETNLKTHSAVEVAIKFLKQFENHCINLLDDTTIMPTPHCYAVF